MKKKLEVGDESPPSWEIARFVARRLSRGFEFASRVCVNRGDLVVQRVVSRRSRPSGRAFDTSLPKGVGLGLEVGLGC